MEVNQQLFERMITAAQNLKSVKRPVPKQIEREEVFRETDIAHAVLTDHTASELLGDQTRDFEKLLILLIVNQRLAFNRPLSQITPRSLIDGLLISLHESLNDAERLALAQTIYLLCGYLEEHQLTTERNLLTRYLDLLDQRAPELAERMDEAIAPDEPDPTVLSREYVNQPVHLLSDETTLFYNQDSSIGIDFNGFIDSVAVKHSPAQLQVAYQLFLGDDQQYQRILVQMMRYQGKQPTAEEEHQILFEFSLIWMFSKALTAEAVIDLAKVFHLFMKFGLTVGLFNARQYAVLQRLGNQALIGVTVSRREDSFTSFNQQQIRFAEGVALADTVFINPNYTISVPKAKQLLARLNVEPVQAFHLSHDHPLKLKKSLGQHQLDLELAQAKRQIADFRAQNTVISEEDWSVYRTMLLEIHREMVVQYNRRQRQWTRESLSVCLETIYQQQPDLDSRPTCLRVLENYLEHLDAAGAIKNVETLLWAVDYTATAYLAFSANRLTKL